MARYCQGCDRRSRYICVDLASKRKAMLCAYVDQEFSNVRQVSSFRLESRIMCMHIDNMKGPWRWTVINYLKGKPIFLVLNQAPGNSRTLLCATTFDPASSIEYVACAAEIQAGWNG